jgi:hypothetical protein
MLRIAELNRNCSSISFFHSSQDSAATHGANLKSASYLSRECQEDSNFRTFGYTTVCVQKHSSQRNILGECGLVSDASRRSQRHNLLDSYTRMKAAFLFW